jgi:hypothetical protein
MPNANLVLQKTTITGGNDSIVIVKDLGDIPGGRTLDVTGVAAGTTVIKAGHTIIEKDGVMKPMPVNSGGTAYASLPSNHNYVGVLKNSIPVSDPRAAILTFGQVNQAACPYPVTDAMKSALKNIQWLY